MDFGWAIALRLKLTDRPGDNVAAFSANWEKPFRRTSSFSLVRDSQFRISHR
jgi:hypothetical protein